MIDSFCHIVGRANRAHRGFTLVEMIVTIVLVGIVAGMVATFIRFPIVGYVDAVARAEITDTGDGAVRRIARDVRLALPNSVRTSPDGSYLELLLTRTGGRYLALEDNPNAGSNILNFSNPAATSFDVVGPTAATGPLAIQNTDYVVVYNLGGGIASADAYIGANRAAIASVAINGGVTTINMVGNPFATESQSSPSTYHRFQIVSSAVTYHYDSVAQTVTRYWNYPISAAQPTSTSAFTSGSSALIATGVASCTFNYSTTAWLTSALLEINMQLTAPTTDKGSGGTIAVFQQVHVDNTP